MNIYKGKAEKRNSYPLFFLIMVLKVYTSAFIFCLFFTDCTIAFDCLNSDQKRNCSLLPLNLEQSVN